MKILNISLFSEFKEFSNDLSQYLTSIGCKVEILENITSLPDEEVVAKTVSDGDHILVVDTDDLDELVHHKMSWRILQGAYEIAQLCSIKKLTSCPAHIILFSRQENAFKHFENVIGPYPNIHTLTFQGEGMAIVQIANKIKELSTP